MRVSYSFPDGKPKPYINLVMCGPSTSRHIKALIDSGSEYNLFSTEFANELGINVRGGRDVGVFGPQGSKHKQQDELPQGEKGKLIVVKYVIDNYEWEGDTVFVDSNKKYGLLGQRGFFDHFDVHFRLASEFFEIKPTIAIQRDSLRPGD